MGAEWFQVVERGASAKEAFDNAVESAQYDYGHAGYTGTIAEKSKFVMICKSPMSLDDANYLIQKMCDNEDKRIRDKWGPCGCIPLTENNEYYFFGWASS